MDINAASVSIAMIADCAAMAKDLRAAVEFCKSKGDNKTALAIELRRPDPENLADEEAEEIGSRIELGPEHGGAVLDFLKAIASIEERKLADASIYIPASVTSIDGSDI